MPEITPALDIVNPAGRLPDAIDHVYPGVPPLAFSVVLYELPVCAAPRLVDVIVNVLGAELTAIDSLRRCRLRRRCTILHRTVNVAVPLAPAAGVPEMTPPLDIVSPAGRLPDAIDHV